MAQAHNESSTGLPLDSSNWILAVDAHRAICGVTTDKGLAARDMTDAGQDGSVSYMRRCVARGFRRNADGGCERVLLGPDRELVPNSHWTKYEFSAWSGGVFVFERPLNPAFRVVVPLKGYVYYAWRPALAKRWPTAFPPIPTSTPNSPVAPDKATKPEPAEKPNTEPTRRLRHGPQIDRVLRDLLIHFPPNGNVPDKLSVRTVRAKLSPGWKKENKDFDLTDPGWDTVKAAMKQLGWRPDD